MELTVSQVILKALAVWGVKNMYGVSGDAILPFMDALGKQNEIFFYSAAQEQGAAFMACGEARVTGRPGVCLATEGPGALNLMNGVADAYHDGVPLLVITGQVESAKLSTNTKQYVDLQQLFAPITGSTSLLTRPESAVETFKIAMEKAIGDNTPCHIAIPKDIFSSPAQDGAFPALGRPLPPGISGNMEEAIKCISSCQKPVIITGKQAVPFRDVVLELAARIGAGILPGQGARGIYPGTCDRFIGGLGEAHIPPLLNHADFVLLIGASPFEHKFVPSGVRVVQVDTRPQNLAHHLRPVSLTGDIALILRRLLEGVSHAEPASFWQDEIKKLHHRHLKMINGEAELSGKPVPPQKLVAVLNGIIPEDAVIAIDTGEFMHWFDRGFIARRQSVIISENWRCMGCGLPFGLGAQAAHPHKTVFVLAGDGGFTMIMQEITTAVRYSLPVIIIIFNNSLYLLEKHRMVKAGMQPFGVDFKPPDFVAFARACGAEGFRVEESGPLRDVIARAMVLKRPVLIDVIVNDSKPLFV